MKVSKNSKVSISRKEYQIHGKPKRPNWRTRCPLAPAPGALKEGTLSDFLISIVAKHQKLKGDLLVKKNFRKKQCRKTGRGTLWDFSPSNQKIEWARPFGEFFSKKSQCRKKLKGDPLVSPGIVCYAEKEEKQMIQFGTIKFRRTFKNYFGQFVWIEKKSL